MNNNKESIKFIKDNLGSTLIDKKGVSRTIIGYHMYNKKVKILYILTGNMTPRDLIFMQGRFNIMINESEEQKTYLYRKEYNYICFQ